MSISGAKRLQNPFDKLKKSNVANNIATNKFNTVLSISLAVTTHFVLGSACDCVHITYENCDDVMLLDAIPLQDIVLTRSKLSEIWRPVTHGGWLDQQRVET